jgi:hypothetical protein
MVSARKQRARCKATSKAINQEAMLCDHYDHPIWMMVVGAKYQARCTGCNKVGPIVNEGPWVAQQDLYRGKVLTH